MATAEVGDDVYRDDPTVIRLEELAAQMLGKEAALFVASGTMGNSFAYDAYVARGRGHTRRRSAYFVHEVGAAAVLSGVTLRQLKFPGGIPDAAMIESAIRTEDIHEPRTSLICMKTRCPTAAW
jgi:threonine aldolase